MAKEFKTNFTIGGKIAKSLEKSLILTEKKIKQTTDRVKKVGKIMATTTVGAATATAAALIGAAESTREYRREQAKLISAFEASNGTAEIAKQTYKSLYRVLGDEGQATEAASLLAQITTNEKELTQWTKACQGVYATFGASLPIEAMVESANETARVGKITGSLADAINWTSINTESWNSVLGGNSNALKAYERGIKSGLSQEDAFNEALAKLNNQSDREALIRATLNDTYSKAASSYEKNASKVLSANEAQAKMTDTMAKLGEKIEPLSSTFKGKFADVLTALSPVVDKIVDGLTKLVNTPYEKIETPLMVIGGAIAAITAGIVAYDAAILVKSAIDKIHEKGLWGTTKAILAQNAAFLMSPIFWIVAGIVALVAGFVILWNKCEGFRNFWIGLWNVIKESAVNVWNKITEVFGNIGGWFSEKFAAVRTAIQPVIDWITEKIEKVKGVFDKVKNFFTGEKGETTVKAYATGGTVTRPHLAVVGDAPETIVPHSNTPRNRALLSEAAKGVGVGLGNNVNITFAPVISGGSGAEVRQAIRESEVEFEQRMDAYFRKKGRVSFA